MIPVHSFGDISHVTKTKNYFIVICLFIYSKLFSQFSSKSWNSRSHSFIHWDENFLRIHFTCHKLYCMPEWGKRGDWGRCIPFTYHGLYACLNGERENWQKGEGKKQNKKKKNHLDLEDQIQTATPLVDTVRVSISYCLECIVGYL